MPHLRPIRNNNPGNLNAGQPWKGLQPEERKTPEQRAEPRFAVFSSPVWGFRALASLLLTYYHVHHLDTVQQIITRYAPPEDNNPTNAYVHNVSIAVGVNPTSSIDLTSAAVLARLCRAISVQEAGGWFFKQADLDTGVALALEAHNRC